MLLLRKLRIDRCLSVEDVTAETGVPVSTIYNLERRSTANPRIATLAPLAKFFDTPASELLTDAAETERSAA